MHITGGWSYISENDEKLLNILFKKNATQSDLDNFLDKWDIEKEGAHKALILSCFMKLHPELTYSQYIEPRLNGILKFYRFKNLQILSHYKRICTALQEANIDILIIKGGALKYYNPEFPRLMGDIDIIVPQKDYQKAKEIALSFGYKYEEYPHSLDIHEPHTNLNVLDIHHKLDTQNSAEYSVYKDLFGRAHKDCAFNVNNIYIPCPEDMMFILLVNLKKNMVRSTSTPSILYSIIDSMHLINLKTDFNWDIVKQNAEQTKTEHQIALALKFLNEYVPEKLPEIFKNEAVNEMFLCFYNESFLKEMRRKSHSLKLGDAFKSAKDFLYYLKFRPLYIICKQKAIRNNIKLAKFVLKNQNLIKL